MSGTPGTPSDWVSGERVFAPPSGTLDVDWLVPAVVESVPGSTPTEARAALVEVWRAHSGAAAAAVPTGDGAIEASDGARPQDAARLQDAAERVVAEALRTFRA